MSSPILNPLGSVSKKPRGKKILGYTLAGILLLGGCGALLDDGSAQNASQQEKIKELEDKVSSKEEQLRLEEQDDKDLTTKIDGLTKDKSSLEGKLKESEKVRTDSVNRVKELEKLQVQRDTEIRDLKQSSVPAPVSKVPDRVEQPAPAVVPKPAPEPVPVAPKKSGQILTCSEVGHKTYEGDGIYIPDHDRDGNGVGCESY